MSIGNRDKYNKVFEGIHYYLYILSFVFVFVGLFSIPKGHEVIEVLVILSVVFGVVNAFINPDRINYDEKLLLFIFCFYGFVVVINHFIHGDWYRYGKAFLFLALFVVFRPDIKNLDRVVFYSVVSGGLILGLLSLYQFSSGVRRVDGFTNAIPFSQALLVILIFNFYFLNKVKGLLKLSVLISIVSIFISLYLSQTRGVWLAFAALVFLYISIKSFKKPVKYISIAFILVVISFIAYDSTWLVKNKLSSGFMDLKKASKGDLHTSWGLRLVAWDSALKAISDNPLIGVGRDNFHPIKHQQVEKKLVSNLALHPALAHTHNQYLQSQLIRGLPGTLSLFLLIAFPFLYFGFFNKEGQVFKAISLAFAIFSLSDVPFEHLNTIYLYAISMVVIFFFKVADDKVVV